MIKEIFIKLAKLYGLELVEKADTHEFFETEPFSVTAALSSRLATITLIDSEIEVVGDSKRALEMNQIINKLENTQLKSGVEIALGTGDCLLYPYTDGEDIGINLIQSQDIAVTDYIGDKIKGCFIKCEEKQIGRAVFERVEYHYLKDGNLYIEQKAFKNNIPCNLDEGGWEIDDKVISNMDSMLFGRIKCPTINRKEVNAFNGVPITYGLDDVIRKSKEAYNRFNKEMEDKESMIFVDKTLLEDDAKGKARLPKRKLFQAVRGGIDETLIKEYSPTIRATELTAGIYENLKMIELLAGISNGVLTPPTTSFATATEIKTNLGMTFAYMQNLRKSIEYGVESLVNAINVLMNLNNITPIGIFELSFAWSDSYVEDTATRASLLLQGESIGAVSKAEFRAYLMNEKLDIAESNLPNEDIEVE